MNICLDIEYSVPRKSNFQKFTVKSFILYILFMKEFKSKDELLFEINYVQLLKIILFYLN